MLLELVGLRLGLVLLALDGWVDLGEDGEPLGEVQIDTNDLTSLGLIQQVQQRPHNLVTDVGKEGFHGRLNQQPNATTPPTYVGSVEGEHSQRDDGVLLELFVA